METKPLNKNRVTVCDINLTPVTPIHIGGEQEKHLKRNFDYQFEDGNVKLIDWEGTISSAKSSAERSNILADLTKGTIEKNRRYNLSYSRSYPWKGNEAFDLKTFIKNGFGIAYLPGTSFKGALRSTMIEAYSPDKNKIQKSNDFEKDTIGTFSESLFSLLTVRDCDFSESLFLCNSKIYNLDGAKNGAWKNAFHNTNETQFKERDFATMAECLTPGVSKSSQIVFQLPAFPERTHKMNATNQKILKEDWSSDPWQWMASTARSYMDTYLQAEVDYFQKFNDAEYSPEVIESLRKLLEFHESLNKNQFLVRMGWGSGFHQMTGNWQYPDHINQALNGGYKNQIKSRKMAFWYDGDQRQFAPMGFMLVELSTGSNSEIDIPFAVAKSKIARVMQQKDIKPAEKPQPTIADPQTLKNNSEIFAEVIGNAGKQVKVKAFIQGYEDKEFQFRYASEIPNGTIIIVRIQFHRRKLKEGFNLVFLRMY